MCLYVRTRSHTYTHAHLCPSNQIPPVLLSHLKAILSHQHPLTHTHTRACTHTRTRTHTHTHTTNTRTNCGSADFLLTLKASLVGDCPAGQPVSQSASQLYGARCLSSQGHRRSYELGGREETQGPGGAMCSSPPGGSAVLYPSKGHPCCHERVCRWLVRPVRINAVTRGH